MRSTTTNSATSDLSWIASLVALLSLLGRATGQDETICSCAPARYTFTFDFGLTCPPVNVTRNGGIAATFCQVSPFGDPGQNITNLVPVEVGYVDVLELGQAFDVLSQENITGAFMDGESFSYTSIVEKDPTLAELPKVIQLNIFAFNSEGQPIVNFFAIAFTNNCFEFPVLLEGDSAGWTKFVKPTDAPVVPPTDAPVPDPTDAPVAPTDAPVEPTDAPVPAPTDAPPVVEPTDAPVPAPTDAPPVAEPTDAPVPAPTDAPPVAEPTDAPVPVPTDVPETMAPTEMDMSMDMSMSMIVESLRGGMFAWRNMQYGIDERQMDMSMSMDLRQMSMSMDMDMAIQLPARRGKMLKREGSPKNVKSSKKGKSAKSPKSGKRDPKMKDKATKAAKSGKSDDGTRRRRLRIHRVD
ncbi:MAG: hypothetical protein SGARI_000941 [Bacillariaceae sp.]